MATIYYAKFTLDKISTYAVFDNVCKNHPKYVQTQTKNWMLQCFIPILPEYQAPGPRQTG